MKSNYNTVVIGAGPNGINCGIELKKAGIDFCILEKGVLVNSLFHFPANMTFFSTSEKLEIGDIPFISHGDKPTRREALEYYRRIFSYFEIPVEFQTEVLGIDKYQNGYIIRSSKGSIHAINVIVATGYFDTPKLMGIPGEDLSKVLHYYDDAHRYIGQKVIVVGGANSACDVALETWQKGAEVTMVVREKELYQKVKYWILPSIENRIKEGSIKAYFKSSLVSISEKSALLATPEGSIELDNDYVLAMTGYQPNYTLLEKFGISVSDDSIKVPTHNSLSFESNRENIYLSGVIRGGLNTSALFIENTREEAKTIIQQIIKRKKV